MMVKRKQTPLAFMEHLGIHLVWAGTFVTISGVLAMAAIAIECPRESFAGFYPAVIALVGPVIALLGTYLHNKWQLFRESRGRSIEIPDNGSPQDQSHET